MSKEKKPVIEGLFTCPPEETRLLVSRCKKCGSVSFPKRPYCPNPDCKKKHEDIEGIRLSKTGKVYSFAVQLYRPPAPFRMEAAGPYALGMVDFPEGLRVWGIFTRKDNLQIGMDVETVAGKLYEDAGIEYITWMWKPID